MNKLGLTHPPRVPPTTISLRESLVRLNICHERDFRRCRRRVRRLARGMPAFDFIWIDALLSAGALTPFQAKRLESAPPEALRVGPCVLLERLGSGEFSETFVAAAPRGLEKVSLKRVRPAVEWANSVFDRLQSLTEQLRGLENPFVVGPHFVEHNDDSLVVLSRHICGPSCRELLIRRGRFPAEVVGQIARQLACGLAALEARGVLHGQLQLANVRLNAVGQAVLVDAGISETFERGLQLRGDVPPEFYEGTGPELIGTGNAKTAASELYAFGCLLWELLAGRPPFPTGDPLAKLAAHQSRQVPDIREFSPDTPPPLAEAIRALTERDPLKRPRSFDEVATRFGGANHAGERRLIQFRRQFDSAAPLARPPARERASRSPAAAFVILLFVAGAGWVMNEAGVWNRLSSLRWSKSSATANAAEEPVAITRSSNHRPSLDDARHSPQLRRLPKPDAEGIVQLGAGLYEANRLSFVGDLTIRGTTAEPAVIVVVDRPLEVVCRKFSLKNVLLSQKTTGEGELASRRAPDSPLLAVRSQDVTIDGCRFSTRTRRGPRDKFPAVVWSAVAARDPDAGRIRLSNTVFCNSGPGVICQSPPGRLEADNCLKLGDALFELPNWPLSRELVIAARHVTLRRAETLCRVTFAGYGNRKTSVHADLHECAFDLVGARASLVQATGNHKIGVARASFVVTGDGSVIRPNIPIAVSTGSTAAASPEQSSVEGLAVGEFQFAGHEGTTPRDSMVDGRSLQIPRQSDATPGIIAERLPLAKAASSALRWANQSQGAEPLAN